MRARGAARSGTVSRVVENALFLLAGKGVGAVLSLVYLGIATRTLGLEGFGQFALILSVAQTVAGLVSFQSWQLVVRYGMAPLAAGEQEKVGRLVAFCAALDVAGALLGCLIAAAALLLLGDHFGWSTGIRLEALFFCIVMLLSIKSTAIGILRLHDRFGMGATADAVTPIMRLLGALAVLLSGPTVTGFLYAWAAAELATAAVYWWFARRTGGPVFRLRFLRSMGQVRSEHGGIFGFAAITNLNSTLAVIAKQFTTIIVGLFAGAAAAGSYRLAFQLSQALAKLSDALSRSIFAELTRVHFGGIGGSLKKLSGNVTRLALVGGVVIVGLLLIAGEPALRLIAGSEFVGAYPLLVLLGAAAAIDLASVGFEPALLVAGRARLSVILRLITSAVLIGLMVALLPIWGAIGAGVAMLVASAVGFLLFWIAARQALGSAEAVAEAS
jgi:O-antigen/teichoic acid export membrane protein